MLHGEEGRRDGRGDVSLFLSDSPSRMSLSYFLARRNDWTGLKKIQECALLTWFRPKKTRHKEGPTARCGAGDVDRFEVELIEMERDFVDFVKKDTVLYKLLQWRCGGHSYSALVIAMPCMPWTRGSGTLILHHLSRALLVDRTPRGWLGSSEAKQRLERGGAQSTIISQRQGAAIWRITHRPISNIPISAVLTIRSSVQCNFSCDLTVSS